MKHERDYRYRNERQKQSSKSRQLGAGVLLAAAIVGPTAYGVNQFIGNEMQHRAEHSYSPEDQAAIKAAAFEIAHKYDACSITSLTDLHTVPASGDQSRTTLRLTLSVDRNPNAADALLKYDNASTYEHTGDVQWTNPELTAFVDGIQVSGPNTNSPDMAYPIPDSDSETDGSNPQESTSDFVIDIHPKAIPGHDGAQMTFNVETNAKATLEGEERIVVDTLCGGTATYDRSVSAWVLER